MAQFTRVKEMPFLDETLSKSLMEPPYKSQSAIMWSPGAKSSIKRLMAAIPLERAKASIPPSS